MNISKHNTTTGGKISLTTSKERKSDSDFILLSRSSESNVTNTLTKSHPKPFNQSSDQPLSKREVSCQNNVIIWRNVISHSNFKTFCILRSASTMMNHLTSMITLNKLQLQKSEEDTQASSVYNLLNSSLIFKSITSPNTELMLRIENLKSLNKLIKVIENHQNKFIIQKIQKLNLEEIEVNPESCNLVNKLLKTNFPNLIDLIIGKSTHLKFPQPIIIYFPISFQNLQTLTFVNINTTNTFTVQDPMNNLRTLIIQNIEGNEIPFQLPNQLSTITTLTVENIDFNTVLQLSNLFNLLKVITIKTMCYKSSLLFPNVLDLLETLIIESIFRNVIIQWPTSLINLTTLVLGNIYSEAVVKLPDAMFNLVDLTLGDVYSGATVELPIVCNALIHLAMGKAYANSRVQLPRLAENLKTLIMQDIEEKAIIEFPNDSLDNLTSIQFGDVFDNLIKERLLAIRSGIEYRTNHAKKRENCCCQ